MFACARFSYAPVKIIMERYSDRSYCIDKQRCKCNINKANCLQRDKHRDAKTLVVVPSKKKNEDVVDWMSRVDLSHSVTISNAGIDSDAFCVRVSIDSTLRNLILLTNDTALDALTSLPLLRGGSVGDPKIEFEAMPLRLPTLLESMEYLNVYSGPT